MKILVVVDYQNDFVKGALGFNGAELLDEGIANKIRTYGEDKDNIVYYTLDTHYEEYLETREGKTLPVVHCIAGTDGHKPYGKTAEALMDVGAREITKETFGISPFEMIKMRHKEVESIEIIGLVTNMCVISNAVVFQARYPEAQIIVDASLCDSFNEELHEKTLDVLEGLQVKLINR